MHYDLIIKNGIIVDSNKSIRGDIAVKGEKIAFTGNLPENVTSDEIYDAAGMHILPGIIDAHVHFRDPGLTEKEDFETGSIAAAFGGITTVADMPNVDPVTATVLCFNEKLQIARQKSYVDFALFALLSQDNMEEMDDLKRSGALGFKVFLGTSTGDIASPSRDILLQQLKKAAALGMRTGFHAETSELNNFFTSFMKDTSYTQDGLMLNNSRPVISENIAIYNAICLAKSTGAKIHIHHVTSDDGACLIFFGKNTGVDITAETCPHYLLLNAKQHTYKVYPPIREENHVFALWNAIKKNVINMIASDHAPHTAEEKMLPIRQTPGGITGIETMVPLMLNEVNNGRLTLNEFVYLASEQPAKTWGIYPQKGNLKPDADADITIVDMSRKKTISGVGLHSKSKTTPYEGIEIKGTPVSTIVRGKFIVKDEILSGCKGYGKLTTSRVL